jgi:hypothetical protein
MDRFIAILIVLFLSLVCSCDSPPKTQVIAATVRVELPSSLDADDSLLAKETAILAQIDSAIRVERQANKGIVVLQTVSSSNS